MKHQRPSLKGLALSVILAVVHCPSVSAAAVTVRGSLASNPLLANSLEKLPGHSTPQPILQRPPAEEVTNSDRADSSTGNGGPPLPGGLDDIISIYPGVSSFSLPVETCIAMVWITMVALLPAIVIKLEGGAITKTQLVLFAVMWVVFFAGIYLFTNVLLFQSAHFKDVRPLTIVESVYFMSQILTTVGYGDITPAKPRGQVFVAFYVLFSLMTMANVISEVTEIVAERSRHLATQLMEESQEMQAQVSDRTRPPALFRRPAVAPKLDFRSLASALAAYVFFAVVGTLFFHFCPGEGKTVLQGVYMSVITLSTVGFGAFTPVTEYGQVFGAFWMLFGSAALVAVIGAFSDLMMQMKLRERWHATKPHEEIEEFLARAPESMSRFDFLKEVLIHRNLVDESDLAGLSAFFDGQCGEDGVVMKNKLEDAAGRLAVPSMFATK